MSTRPYPFQASAVRKTVRRLAKRKGVLVAYEQGLGKCLISLKTAKETRSWPLLIICHASLKWMWQDEVRRHLGMRSQVLDGMRPPRQWPGLLKSKIYIINYTILGPWTKHLESLGLKMIVIDECQALQGRWTKRTRATRRLCRDVPNVVALSGTPLVNRPADLWPTANILWPDRFPNFMEFAQEHCGAKMTKWGRWDFSGATDLEGLHHKLESAGMIRQRKDQVLSQLPDKTHTVVRLPLSDRTEYDEAQREFIPWLRRQCRLKAGAASKAEQMVKFGYLLRLAAKLKLQSAYKWIDSFLRESDDKLLVFGVHRAVLHPLHHRLGRAAVLVDGHVLGRTRKLLFDRFNKDPRIRVFAGNVQAAGTGWSCTSSSSVAFLETGWTPGGIGQCIDRVHGINRGRDGRGVSVYFLVGNDTVEYKLYKALQKKSRTVNAVLDGGGNGRELDVWDDLKRSLLESDR